MAKAYDLTTEANVKALGRIRATDPNAAAKLPFLISAASKAIARYSRRMLLGLNQPGDTGYVDPAVATPKTFEYDGSGYLSLAPYEAREIVSVTVDGEALAAADYKARPTQKTPESTYYTLKLPVDPKREEVDVVVNAKWGIVGVPEDVELACIRTVAYMYRNPEGTLQRAVGDGQFLGDVNDPDDSNAIPWGARSLLIGFVRS